MQIKNCVYVLWPIRVYQIATFPCQHASIPMSRLLFSLLFCLILVGCVFAQKKTTKPATTTPVPTTTTPVPPFTGTCPSANVEQCEQLGFVFSTQCSGLDSYETCQISDALDVQLCKDTPGCDVATYCAPSRCQGSFTIMGVNYKPCEDYNIYCTGVCAISPAPQC